MTEREKHSRMYDSNLWRALRLGVLSRGAKCKCGADATDVVHTHKHRGCWAAFIDKNNIAPVCAEHASVVAA